MVEEKREIFEFKFMCAKCGHQVITRTDDGISVKDCTKCGGDMKYVSMKEIDPNDVVSEQTKHIKSLQL